MKRTVARGSTAGAFPTLCEIGTTPAGNGAVAPPSSRPAATCSLIGGALVVAALLASVTAARAMSPDDFPFRRALHSASPIDKPVGVVELDEDIFSATDDVCGNLRLFDEMGTEVPYILRPRRYVRVVEREVDIGFLQERVQLLPDNRIEISLFKTNAEASISILDLSTPLNNFEKHVDVLASSNGSTWYAVAEKQPIFDYTRYMSVRNTRVVLTPTTDRFLRVLISNISEARQSPLTHLEQERRGDEVIGEVERLSFQRQDLRIDRVRLRGVRSATLPDEPMQREYVVHDVVVTNEFDSQQTTVRFQTMRAPITALDVLTSTPNFSRAILVDGADSPDGPWRQLTAATMTRIRAGDYREEALTVSLPRASCRAHYRLRIRNLDSPPLEIEGVVAYGQIQEALFFADAAHAYTMYYGGRALPAPLYDVGSALARTLGDDAVRYTPAAPEENTAFQMPPAEPWWNRRALLVVMVVAMVVALVWVLAHAMRRLPPPEDEPPAGERPDA